MPAFMPGAMLCLVHHPCHTKAPERDERLSLRRSTFLIVQARGVVPLLKQN